MPNFYGNFRRWRSLKGNIRVLVSTKRLRYELNLRRNITIIQGDSASGKTTMIQIISDYLVCFDDGTGIFVSIQMYGGITICPRGQCTDGYYVSASTKPDPLTDGFTYDYFRSLYPASGKRLSAKAFLATQQRIPGLGNGVLQDILWDAGIDPRYPMQDASEEDFHILYESVCKIIRKMAAKGGRDTERDLFGQKGGYITQMSKNSLNEPCVRCGYEIHKANYMGGTIYFCEHCQRR